MITKIFLTVLNMSITASIAILVIFLVRCLLTKLPKIFSYILWVVVLFRLLCPISFSSSASLFSMLGNSVGENGVLDYISETNLLNETPSFQTPDTNENIIQGAKDTADNITSDNHDAIVSRQVEEANHSPADTSSVILNIATGIWLVGIFILVSYSVISSLTLHKKLLTAEHLRDNIFISERINTAFVIGLIRPRIYLPATLDDAGMPYIICHEQTHIRRKDHIFKLAGFFALSLHWFNPLVWAAFFASSKDMEMSCDEAVIRQLGNHAKKDYASYLLSLASGKKLISPSPLAFGEDNTRNRIKNILHYKKTATIVTIALLLLCGAGIWCLSSNPSGDKNSTMQVENNTPTITESDSQTNTEASEKTKVQNRVILCDATLDRQTQTLRATYLIEGDYEALEDTDITFPFSPQLPVAHQTTVLNGETITGLMVKCVGMYETESQMEVYFMDETGFQEHNCMKADSFSITEVPSRSFSVNADDNTVNVNLSPFSFSIEGESGWMQENTFYRFVATMDDGSEKEIYLLPIYRTGKQAEKKFLEGDNMEILPSLMEIEMGQEIMNDGIATGAKFVSYEDIDIDTISDITVHTYTY